MRRPYKNIQAFREVKTALNSNYLEYNRLSETKEDPDRLNYLITLISSIEAKLIIHLKSRRIGCIPRNYDKIRFTDPPKYYG